MLMLIVATRGEYRMAIIGYNSGWRSYSSALLRIARVYYTVLYTVYYMLYSSTVCAMHIRLYFMGSLTVCASYYHL